MSANDEQVGGTHYKDMGIQLWDFMRECMSAEAFAGYLQGCCIKYLSRFQRKGGIEDLRKARHYLDKLIEVMTQPGGDAESEAVDSVEKLRESLGMDWYCLTFGKTGSSDAHKALSNQIEQLVPVQMAGSPAVSESAAGDDYQYDCSKVGKTDFNQHCPCCGKWGHIPSNWPSAEWPGPDWSQAPDVSHFTRDRIDGWRMGQQGIAFWLLPDGIWGQAPSFNYPGHWRDSLRRRPTPAA